MTTMNIPPPVAEYVAATNAFNLERLLATFRDDALVNDHRDEFAGKEQIRAWAAREIVGDHVTLHVVSVRRLGDHAAVTAEVDGDFDKKGLPSPLVLTFYFSVTGDKISSLIIVANKPAKAAS
jgi:ketosteroid isomerase-like protein